ncbi:MAG: DUF2795 domain-containing protein [Patescibacteria group bacterium]
MQSETNQQYVEKYISGVGFPATKERIVSHAKSQDAPQNVVDALEKIDNREYGGPVDLAGEISSKTDVQ